MLGRARSREVEGLEGPSGSGPGGATRPVAVGVGRRPAPGHHPGLTVELVEIKTQGDRDRNSPLAAIGGAGLFTKEIQRALVDGLVEVAVHSLKDLPTKAPKG